MMLWYRAVGGILWYRAVGVGWGIGGGHWGIGGVDGEGLSVD